MGEWTLGMQSTTSTTPLILWVENWDQRGKRPPQDHSRAELGVHHNPPICRPCIVSTLLYLLKSTCPLLHSDQWGFWPINFSLNLNELEASHFKHLQWISSQNKPLQPQRSTPAFSSLPLGPPKYQVAPATFKRKKMHSGVQTLLHIHALQI